MNSIVFILLFLNLSALKKTLALPHLSSHNMLKRNDTAAATQQMTLNIDPDIVNPACGGVVEANINVEYAPDPFYLSAACNKILNYIGGPKGNKDVDVILTCTGQPANTNGTGDRDVKVVLSTAPHNVLNANDKGVQEIPANMELVSEKDDFLVSTGVQLGFKVKTQDGQSDTVAQFIYC